MSDLKMILVGDAYVQREDPESAFAPNKAYFSGADVFFCNLETVVADAKYVVERPMRRAPRTDEATLAYYLKAGINVMNVANNPSTYHGLDCFLRSLDVLDEQGVIHGGGGRDLAEARRPALIERQGTSVAFVCRTSVCLPDAAATASRAGVAHFRITTVFEPRSRLYEVPGTPPITRTYPHPADSEALAEDISNARAMADVVVLSWHWGLSPSSGARGELAGYQTEMAHFAIDAGADLVIGHHPHMLQPIEVYNGKVIAYSLGNYVHDLTSGSARLTSMLLQCSIRDGAIREVAFVPGWVEGAGPALYCRPEEAMDLVEGLRAASAQFGTVLDVTAENVRIVV
jgi:poly-gamma-glutamate synthesis protein (capsule biosynthesis protein)